MLIQIIVEQPDQNRNNNPIITNLHWHVTFSKISMLYK